MFYGFYMSEKTTIGILKYPTRKRLKVYKAKHDFTYDQAINNLLDQVEEDTE